MISQQKESWKPESNQFGNMQNVQELKIMEISLRSW